MARQRKREARYPYQAAVALPSEVGAALEALADQDGVAVGVLIRSAFLRGWPNEKESRRKARKSARKSAAQASGEGAAK